MATKRKYTKRDCKRWGHSYEFYGACNKNWIFKCVRPGCGHLKESIGMDQLAANHLINLTVKDMPTGIGNLWTNKDPEISDLLLRKRK